MRSPGFGKTFLASGLSSPAGQRINAARDGISLPLEQGEIVCLIGCSGAGKSTLIRCLNGLDRSQAVWVVIDSADITHLSEQELQPIHRRIGMIFQHFNLLSAKTVA